MNKLVALVISTIASAAPIAAHASPVTWSFYETAITSCQEPLNCVLPPQPFVLMTMTLPGPTSAGTADWGGSSPPSVPVYTGDSFALSLPFDVIRGPVVLTPAFAGNPGGLDCLQSPLGSHALCDFDISWSETAGVLTAISISVEGPTDFVGGLTINVIFGPFGLTGGPVGSDGIIGGCGDTQCTVSGFWQSDLTAVPEPISAVLLITGLLGTCLASRARPNT